MGWENVEPKVIRQRLIIEGTTKEVLPSEKIKEYLNKLSKVSGMKTLTEPIGYDKHPGGGSAFWIHWDSSGAHFYCYARAPNEGYEEELEFPLFTLDTYTCKPFDIQKVVDFTKEFFNPVNMVWKEIKV
ncbi:MAG: hypothetical protein U9Q99_01680 [Nanoarchaeota archaeon]|nr:hypothetical protein [Nanoarchaeota archaeon]